MLPGSRQCTVRRSDLEFKLPSSPATPHGQSSARLRKTNDPVVASMCVTHPLGPLAASSAASVAASLAAFRARAASANWAELRAGVSDGGSGSAAKAETAAGLKSRPFSDT